MWAQCERPWRAGRSRLLPTVCLTGETFSSRGNDLAPLISPNQTARREILPQCAFLWVCPGRIKSGRRRRRSVDMTRTALERRSRPFYRAPDRSGVSRRRRRFHPFSTNFNPVVRRESPIRHIFYRRAPIALSRSIGGQCGAGTIWAALESKAATPPPFTVCPMG